MKREYKERGEEGGEDEEREYKERGEEGERV